MADISSHAKRLKYLKENISTALLAPYKVLFNYYEFGSKTKDSAATLSKAIAAFKDSLRDAVDDAPPIQEVFLAMPEEAMPISKAKRPAMWDSLMSRVEAAKGLLVPLEHMLSHEQPLGHYTFPVIMGKLEEIYAPLKKLIAALEEWTRDLILDRKPGRREILEKALQIRQISKKIKPASEEEIKKEREKTHHKLKEKMHKLQMPFMEQINVLFNMSWEQQLQWLAEAEGMEEADIGKLVERYKGKQKFKKKSDEELEKMGDEERVEYEKQRIIYTKALPIVNQAERFTRSKKLNQFLKDDEPWGFIRGAVVLAQFKLAHSAPNKDKLKLIKKFLRENKYEPKFARYMGRIGLRNIITLGVKADGQAQATELAQRLLGKNGAINRKLGEKYKKIRMWAVYRGIASNPVRHGSHWYILLWPTKMIENYQYGFFGMQWDFVPESIANVDQKEFELEDEKEE